jgi:serine/threonine protein kinase
MSLARPAFMSREQTRGKPVDKGADIWAFGVGLSEMLTKEEAKEKRQREKKRANRG